MIQIIIGNKKIGILILAVASAASGLAALAQNSNPEFITRPEVTADTILYSRIKYALYFFWPLFNGLIAWLMLQSKLAKRLEDWVRVKIPLFSGQITFYYCLVTLAIFIAGFPARYLSSFQLEHHFHLSNLSLANWFYELMKHLFLAGLFGSLLTIIFFGIIRRFPRHWWLALFAALSPLIALGFLCEPLVIEPFFNNFRPLEPGRLKSEVTKLANLSGIKNATILVADKSKQTRKMNAYVTGIGPSARIVFYDTLVGQMPEKELLCVAAHEIGHYKLGHLYWGLGLSLCFLFIFLFLCGRYAQRILAKTLPPAWGITKLDDLALIPFFIMTANFGSLLFAPLENGISRHMEQQADEYGLRLTKDPLSTAHSFIILSRTSLSDPNPPAWIEFWIFSHPSLQKRIDFALGTKDGA